LLRDETAPPIFRCRFEGDCDMNSEQFPFGSTWIRTDFHLHTNADKEFTYDGDPNYYETAYVETLKNADIKLGVITNHNKFDAQEFKTLSKLALKSSIFLLPGVELSVNEGSSGVHVLVVFSPKWVEGWGKGTVDRINQFLGAVFSGRSPSEYQNENACCAAKINDISKELKKWGDEYDHFFIFAHVEDSKGLWNELRGGLLSSWQHSAYEDVRKRTLGFQKVRTYDKKEMVKGVIGEWYPAEVEGSDCKSIDQIGKGEPCYLKLGSYSFEALKFALKYRVSSELPRTQHTHIQSVSFKGGALNGQKINLSPELNTLIGIRGSGKSSIIEAIRYCLDLPFGENVQDKKYKTDLIKHILGSGGEVALEVVGKHGIVYEIRRILGHSPEVFIDGKLQPTGISIRETILSKPLYFGQKDLSSSGEGFEAGLVEKLLETQLAEIRQKIQDQKSRVVTAVDRIQAVSNGEAKIEEYAKKKEDIDFQLKQAEKYNFSEKLQKQLDFDTDARKIKEIQTSVQSLSQALQSLLMEHEDDIRNHASYSSKQNSEFFKEFFALYAQVVSQIDAIKAAGANLSESILPALARQQVKFEAILGGLNEEFAEVQRQMAQELKEAGVSAISPSEYRTLQNSLQRTNQMLVALKSEQAKYSSFEEELLQELSLLNGLWHEEFLLVKAEMDKVNASASSLTIEVAFKENKETYKKYLKDILRGSSLRDLTIDKLIEKFPDPVEMYKNKVQADDILAASAGLFWEHVNRQLGAFLTYQAPNRISVRYKGKELLSHSLGQRASAMILFILSRREHEVVIIDQPEDDLDNQTIYKDVIKLILAVKPETQFVFATHNPNIPVLGDAEMVVACSYAKENIETTSGSIDDEKIQAHVVGIMEGGKEAFDRRKEIYDIWNPQSFSK